MVHMMRILTAFLFVTAAMIIVAGCQDGVLTFPTPEPAVMRIVNVTMNVPRARVIVDSTTTIEADRGNASEFVEVAAGRQINVQLGSSQRIFRSNLRYTLGGNARVILFVRGDTTKLVEFRREIQDTVLPDSASGSVIRFTHMAENVDKAYFLEIWITGGGRLFTDEFEPGISSRSFFRITPGTYSFEVREAGTSNVLARLNNVTIDTRKSYMLYTYDSSTQMDDITLAIF